MKQQMNARISKLTASQLATLVSKTGMNQTEVISVAIDRMYNKEIEMKNTFKTLFEAIGAGYTKVSHSTDKDISGGSYFGYQYQNEQGEKTVTVWLTDEKNNIGGLGCFLPMYPPQAETVEQK